MDFPRTDSELNTLATQMQSGMTATGSPFAGLTKTAAQIGALQTDFNSLDGEILAAQAQLNALFEQKAVARAALQSGLKTNISAAEQQVGKKSDSLRQIGWGPQADPKSLQAPAQCGNFRLHHIQGRTLDFDWDKPSYSVGGKPTGFTIFKRTTGTAGAWLTHHTIFSGSAHEDISEFESGNWDVVVAASNGAGQGPLSNFVSVTVG